MNEKLLRPTQVAAAHPLINSLFISHFSLSFLFTVALGRMRTATYIVLILAIVGCDSSPGFNPFDEQYDVYVRDIVKNGCDILSAGCGYYNIQAKEGRLRPFYQIFLNDYEDVLAKGFTYYEDPFLMNGVGPHRDDNLFEVLINKPIDSVRFNLALAGYNYQFLGKSGRQIKIGSSGGSDTIILNLNFHTLKEDSVVIRHFEYWKSKK